MDPQRILSMTRRTMKIGELAKRADVSVRALHHYDEMGLLRPSCRTDSGHRLYDEDDLVRLVTVRSLQAVGFALEEIRTFLQRPDASVARAFDMVVQRANDALADQQQLCKRLDTVSRLLDPEGEASLDDLVTAIEEIAMFEKYYTKDQLKQLEERAEVVGPERIQAVQQEWQDLFAAFRGAQDKGLAPTDPEVVKLNAKRDALIAEFTGGDPGILASLGKMWAGEPSLKDRYDIDDGVVEYMSGPSAPGDDA